MFACLKSRCIQYSLVFFWAQDSSLVAWINNMMIILSYFSNITSLAFHRFSKNIDILILEDKGPKFFFFFFFKIKNLPKAHFTGLTQSSNWVFYIGVPLPQIQTLTNRFLYYLYPLSILHHWMTESMNKWVLNQYTWLVFFFLLFSVYPMDSSIIHLVIGCEIGLGMGRGIQWFLLLIQLRQSSPPHTHVHTQ